MVIATMLMVFKVFILAAGLGVGFWILITAFRQDKRWVSVLGQVFAWILIGITAIASLLTCIAAFRAWSTGTPAGCPMHQQMMQRRQMMQGGGMMQGGSMMQRNGQQGMGNMNPNRPGSQSQMQQRGMGQRQMPQQVDQQSQPQQQ